MQLFRKCSFPTRALFVAYAKCFIARAIPAPAFRFETQNGDPQFGVLDSKLFLTQGTPGKPGKIPVKPVNDHVKLVNYQFFPVPVVRNPAKKTYRQQTGKPGKTGKAVKIMEPRDRTKEGMAALASVM